jgi:hypothetical protein
MFAGRTYAGRAEYNNKGSCRTRGPFRGRRGCPAAVPARWRAQEARGRPLVHSIAVHLEEGLPSQGRRARGGRADQGRMAHVNRGRARQRRSMPVNAGQRRRPRKSTRGGAVGAQWGGRTRVLAPARRAPPRGAQSKTSFIVLGSHSHLGGLWVMHSSASALGGIGGIEGVCRPPTGSWAAWPVRAAAQRAAGRLGGLGDRSCRFGQARPRAEGHRGRRRQRGEWRADAVHNLLGLVGPPTSSCQSRQA